jgi:hypothetical protein
MRRAVAIAAVVVLATAATGCGEERAPPAAEPSSNQAAEQLAEGAQVEMIESTPAAVMPGLGELTDVALGTPLEEEEGDREDSTGRFRMQAQEPEPSTDPVLERAPSESQLGGPLSSFDGIAYDAGLAFCCPPDAVGDVGPNHYVEWVNSGLRVYDRAGNPLTDLLPGSALFTGLPADHLCRTSNLGDPIVVYDQFADRWVLTQFAFAIEADDDPVGPSYSCVAVSRTPDPVAGGWCAYAFVWSDTTFYDYPKLGVWGDYYLLTGIGYTKTDAGWRRVDQQLAAIEREGPLNCDEGQPARAVRVLRTLRASTPITQMLFLPADADGNTPAPADAPPLFVAIWDDGWDPAYADAVWTAELEQATDGTTLIEYTEVPGVAPFDSNLCVYDRPCLSVPEGAPRLDALSDRLMNRAAYRRFDRYGALALTHAVDVEGLDRAGIRWYELRDSGDGWQVATQGTFAPDDGNSRWLGSAALDAAGNLAVVYATAGPSTYPSIRYAARRAGDPDGSLALGEGVLVEGGGVQLDDSNRWGDYASLAVDPLDDCTFWYTGQYYPATATWSWATKVVSFRLPGCSP